MATPTSTSTPADPVTAPPPHRPPFLPSSHPLRPLFPSPQSLLGKPLHPPPSAPHYPRSFHVRPRPHPDNQAVTVANPAGYIRNTSPTAVMTFAPGQPRPYVFAAGQPHAGGPDHAGARPQVHPMRPPPQFMVPRQIGPGNVPGPMKSGGSVAAHPKVVPPPSASLASEPNNSKERDKSREDPVAMVHGRKVRLSEGGSGSLYALCRSWIRNGMPQENQPTIGDGVKILPKPLPASMIDYQLLKHSEDASETEDLEKEEDIGSIEKLSARDLLEGHIKHAKKVRARLRKQRLRRIERFKKRLSLLLPPPSELLARSDAAPGS